MKCPRCGFDGKVYKCNACGDVRCDSNSFLAKSAACASSKGPTGGNGAQNGGSCKACGKGKYVKI
ncbi:MAG: hypothetical protein IPL26_13730 [Leptospiraceae bacterium]|nr:hypothetical protein [Leptospiraceae bacterium]